MSNDANQLKNKLMVDYAASVENGLKADFDGVIVAKNYVHEKKPEG